MASRRSSRASRKSRAARKSHRSRKMRRQRGGQAPLDDDSMGLASQNSLTDGQGFNKFHASQHGGQAPVDYTGMLDDSLRAASRVAPLDASMDAIQGMSDQSGGRRRRRKAYSFKQFGKNSKSFFGRLFGTKKGRGGTRRRKQRGGNAPVGEPYTLLPPDLAGEALAGQNPEMALAQNPRFLAPGL